MCKSKPEKVLWFRIICGAGRLRQSLQHPNDEVHEERVRRHIGFGLLDAFRPQASTTTPSGVRCIETIPRVAEQALHMSLASVASNPVLSPRATVLTKSKA